MYKNIIFDWSGVVKDCVEDFLGVVNSMFRDFGAKEISLKEFQQTWIQPYMLFYEKHMPGLTLERQQVAYKKATALSPKAKAYPGIAELIQECKKQGIRMAVLSSDFPETLLPEMKSFGLEGFFDDIVTDVEDKTDGLREIIERNGFEKEETLFIGDSNHEIEVGKIVGVKTAAVTWGFSTKGRLAALNPDHVVSSLDELRSVIF